MSIFFAGKCAVVWCSGSTWSGPAVGWCSGLKQRPEQSVTREAGAPWRFYDNKTPLSHLSTLANSEWGWDKNFPSDLSWSYDWNAFPSSSTRCAGHLHQLSPSSPTWSVAIGWWNCWKNWLFSSVCFLLDFHPESSRTHRTHCSWFWCSGVEHAVSCSRTLYNCSC